MFGKVAIVLFIIYTLQNGECYTRVDLRSQFQPTLLRLRDLANVKLQGTNHEYQTLVTQLNKHQTRSRNSTQTQINSIKKVIVDAKKSVNVTGTILTCLKNQETLAARLTTTSLNPCYSNSNLTVLRNSKDKFNTLAQIALNTVNYCQYLNPLDTQLEPFGRCLADKVPDLNKQINIVETEYQKLSNATLQYNIRCLTENMGNIMGQISVISYEVNLCFFPIV